MIKETGGAAFPLPHSAETIAGAEGMTLRDYFAAKAMQADISNATGTIQFEIEHWNLDAIAIRAYKMADEMLEARK